MLICIHYWEKNNNKNTFHTLSKDSYTNLNITETIKDVQVSRDFSLSFKLK